MRKIEVPKPIEKITLPLETRAVAKMDRIATDLREKCGDIVSRGFLINHLIVTSEHDDIIASYMKARGGR